MIRLNHSKISLLLHFIGCSGLKLLEILGELGKLKLNSSTIYGHMDTKGLLCVPTNTQLGTKCLPDSILLETYQFEA